MSRLRLFFRRLFCRHRSVRIDLFHHRHPDRAPESDRWIAGYRTHCENCGRITEWSDEVPGWMAAEFNGPFL